MHGFGYFDQRDLLGFVDGTENPAGQEALDAALIGAEDAEFVGGSYVIVQKYLHDLAGWNALPTEMQERIIGRTKLSDIELDAAAKPSWAHNELNKIVENGREIKILRANMPFGRAGQGGSGTYYIAYARSPRTIEQMLENMFVGKPLGNYDRNPRFQPGRDRYAVLRPVGDLSRQCGRQRTDHSDGRRRSRPAPTDAAGAR